MDSIAHRNRDNVCRYHGRIVVVVVVVVVVLLVFFVVTVVVVVAGTKVAVATTATTATTAAAAVTAVTTAAINCYEVDTTNRCRNTRSLPFAILRTAEQPSNDLSLTHSLSLFLSFFLSFSLCLSHLLLFALRTRNTHISEKSNRTSMRPMMTDRGNTKRNYATGSLRMR